MDTKAFERKYSLFQYYYYYYSRNDYSKFSFFPAYQFRQLNVLVFTPYIKNISFDKL